jgi:hypothetical protein
MFYDIDKLTEIENKVCNNLSIADNLSDTNNNNLRSIWINYRTDMATMISVLREYKDLLITIKESEKQNGND